MESKLHLEQNFMTFQEVVQALVHKLFKDLTENL